jgi:hypothetical protein
MGSDGSRAGDEAPRRTGRAWLAVPLMFAVYPMVNVYARNIDEIDLVDMAIPLAAALLLAVVVTALFLAVLRSVGGAVVLSSVVLAVVFTYGHLVDAVRGTGLGHGQTVVVASASLLVAGVAFGLWRGFLPPAELTRIAGAVGGVLLVFSLVATASAQTRLARADAARSEEREELASAAASGQIMPDIYYLVLDRYCGQETLETVMDYDNSEFLGFLEDSGFYVASKANSNYSVTYPSLGSSLNMMYLDEYTDIEDAEDRREARVDRGPFYDIIEDNAALRTLKGLGYTYVHVTSGWGPTDDAPEADFLIRTDSENELYSILTQTTILKSFAETRAKVHQRDRITRTFEELAAVPAVESPKFVFAHLIFPHPPYVFDAEGDPVDVTLEDFVDDRAYTNELYLGQLQYANELVTELVEEILEKEEGPFVIMVQGDHGHIYRVPGETITDEIHRRRMHHILSAYYFSEGTPDSLYESISPVNSFRVVFNEYFDAGLPLLEDRSYLSEAEDWPYWPEDVTDVVRID